jgi:hypothetical protein
MKASIRAGTQMLVTVSRLHVPRTRLTGPDYPRNQKGNHQDPWNHPHLVR